MSLSLLLQHRMRELLATKRMSDGARGAARLRYVQASSAGQVRVLIRELETLEDMSEADVEWQDIEDSYDEITNVIGKE